MNESNNWPAPDPIQAASAQKSIDSNVQLADFGQRFFAFLLDGVMTFTALIIGSIGIGYVAVMFGFDTNDDSMNLAAVLLVIALVFLRIYWMTQGGSPLRRRYGFMILDENSYSTISFSRAAVRLIIAAIFSPFFFGLGFLWMLWDPKKQTWHDKAARTLVVKR